jgi:hypothetical protein
MKKILLITICFFTIGMVLYYYETNFDLNSNSFEVELVGLDKKKLKIYKGENLSHLINKKEKLIFNKGKKKTLNTNYGENDFVFVYSDSLCCKIRHIKTNDNQVDKYNFELKKMNDSIIIYFNVVGTDNYSFQDFLMSCKSIDEK